ncbi:hypothetical protein PPGU19_098070 (plasmid) [Paraburkholderia sp. PGU19]|nr:hypothetical protein PPGU19_098070 [Paraburkholderia sp. PGU19]
MLQEIRSEIALTLQQAGVQIEVHHHEVATAGQNEIDMRFATLTRMADNVMIYKYICKNVARRHGKVATFMPKPLFADNANGMHCHQSLWKDELNPHHGAHLLRCFDSTTYRNARARDRSAHARRSARGPLR